MPIVASRDERTQQAAKYLADRVEEMTGARPEIKDDWSGRAVRLETTAKRGNEAFRVVSKYGGVFMTGAAYNAAYAFAERVLGAAKVARLVIPAQDFQSKR